MPLFTVPLQHESVTERRNDIDFYRRLERIDLYLQRGYLQHGSYPPDALQPCLLSVEEIDYYLSYPTGKSHWLAPESPMLYDDAVKTVNQRLQTLMARFSLNDDEVDILLAGLLTRFSSHYVVLFSQLNPGGRKGMLAREMLPLLYSGDGTCYRRIHAALHPAAPLLSWQLMVELPEDERSPHWHGLVTQAAVWRYLMEGALPSGEDMQLVCHTRPDFNGWCPPDLRKQLKRLWPVPAAAQGSCPLLIIEGSSRDGREQAIALALSDTGAGAYRLNLLVLEGVPRAAQSARLSAVLRDSVLAQSGLLLDADQLHESSLALLNRPLPLASLRVAILSGASGNMPDLPDVACVQLRMMPPSLQQKVSMLLKSLLAVKSTITRRDLLALCRQYSFNAVSVPLLLREADCYRKARNPRAPLSKEDLRLALNRRSGRDFGGLAQRITPQRTFDDLILAPEVHAQIKEMLAAIRWQESVAQKHFRRKGGLQTGISALFYGESGTGKTLAAETLAYYLGVDLIKVDLSTVINKYIGETEKNLSRIFDLAEADSGVLFFDEADALFGKRSETKDAHDRHANIEVSYLLQRLENYPGMVILATNNRNHLDPAFNRRFTFITRFTYPDVALRQQLWQAIWPVSLPLANDIDFRQLAAGAALTGANIRNAALLAAALAADEKCRVIQLHHIELAIQRELSKHGRLPLE